MPPMRGRGSRRSPEPQALAEAAEAALDLSRPQRRAIQRHLRALGHYDRGIDGLFGPGTRSAIAAWQTSQGLSPTGFLDAAQLAALTQQGQTRQAEIEAEEQRAREEAERADRAFWQVTGQGASVAGARAYLDRYPNGLFAEEARARLEAAEVRAVGAADRAAWQEAAAQDTVPAYTAYLNQFPNGAFVPQANARLAALQPQDAYGALGYTPAEEAALQAAEDRLNMPPISRSLIEQRLAALGLDPGRVDGRFDRATRNAIVQYQQARGLSVTGFLNQPTFVRLLAESILR